MNDETDLEHRLEEQAASFDPRPAYVASGRKRLEARLRATPQFQPGWRNALRPHWERLPVPAFFRPPRPAVTYALLGLIVLMAFFSGSVVGRAAPTWLPGDMFYPIKMGMESVRLAFSSSMGQQAQAHIDFAERRLLEAQALAFEGRYDELPVVLAQFNGHIDRAVLRIDVLANTHPDEARRLATALQASVSSQRDLVEVLAQLSPEPARSQFRRALSIAQTSLWAIQDLISPLT